LLLHRKKNRVVPYQLINDFALCGVEAKPVIGLKISVLEQRDDGRRATVFDGTINLYPMPLKCWL
jgi:hypothetical protein